MLRWLQSFFQNSNSRRQDENEDLIWNAMVEMDSRNSLERLRQLQLEPEQFEVVKGLVDGTLRPADRIGVRDWCRTEGVSDQGIDAVAFALRGALESVGITYVFSKPGLTPVAMIPRYVNFSDLTIVVSFVGPTPVIISSLKEFLQSQGISEYSLETLTPSLFRRRMTNTPDFAKDRLDRERSDSVTIEKYAEKNGHLREPLETADLLDAIHRELGYELSPHQLILDDQAITLTGLYTVIAQIDTITQKKIPFWIVPKVEL